MASNHHARAFSLLELLIVICIVGILAGLLMPNLEPSLPDTLNAAAEVVAGDLAYARSLAVANGDAYKLTFDLSRNRYQLSHSGPNAALNLLPRSSFRSKLDSTTSQVTDLASLPNMGAVASLLGVVTGGAAPASVGNVEFGSLGQTTQTNPTVIWLAAGANPRKRYLSVTVNATTGLASIGDVQAFTPVIAGTNGNSGS